MVILHLECSCGDSASWHPPRRSLQSLAHGKHCRDCWFPQWDHVCSKSPTGSPSDPQEKPKSSKFHPGSLPVSLRHLPPLPPQACWTQSHWYLLFLEHSRHTSGPLHILFPLYKPLSSSRYPHSLFPHYLQVSPKCYPLMKFSLSTLLKIITP